MTLSFIFTRKQGRAMARNMQYYYRKQTTLELRTSKSKKLRQLQEANQFNNWYAKKDRNRLQRQLDCIEIELERRASQTPLF